MRTFRAILFRHRALAAVLLCAALLLKVLVPTGYMIGSSGKVLTISVCSDASGQKLTHQIVVPMKKSSGSEAASKGECPYSALSMGVLGSTDPELLALALAFILALGFAPRRMEALRTIARLRPPLRAPPLAA